MNSRRRENRSRPAVSLAILLALFSACGKKSGSAVKPTPPEAGITLNPPLPQPLTPDPPNPPGTTREAVESLEKSGALPKLDRSPGFMGRDDDGNKVRDDVDAYIKSQGLSEKETKATVRLAAGLQQLIMVDVGNDAEFRRVSAESHKSIVCLMRVFNPAGSQPNIAKPQEILNRIEAITFNTRERALAYMNYNRARSGSVSTAPSGDDCE